MSKLTSKQLVAILSLFGLVICDGCEETDCDDGGMGCEHICDENARVCESNCAYDDKTCSKACCPGPTAEVTDLPTTYYECIHLCVDSWYNWYNGNFPSDDACFDACAEDHASDAGVADEIVECIEGCQQVTPDCNNVCAADLAECESGCDNNECSDYVDPKYI